nr:YceI family protein [Chloroflexota bacterium]
MWVIDGAASRAGFAVRNLVVKTIKGNLSGVEGYITIHESNPSLSTVEITIPATSVDTGNPRRDTHLRGPDFLEVERF